jgi:Uma2 family endonuclease
MQELGPLPTIVRRGMTAADYFAMPDTHERFELVEGTLVRMPSPISLHQMLVGYVFAALLEVQRRSGGLVLVSPLDVELAVRVVFQPDVLYLAPGRESLARDHVYGAPDVIVEVASPSTQRYDRETKLPLCAAHGVREFWVVDPQLRTVSVFDLADGGVAASRTVLFGEPIPSRIVDVGDASLALVPEQV